ncbi:MAG: AMP-binding protein [Chloroflexota bacterium]|nr:AMP-binding protein [Chloroflexota bacterium]
MRVRTLQSLVTQLPAYGERRAVGLRREYGLRWWSYRQLYDESWRVAACLQAMGVRRGQRILLWSPNCPEWLSFLLGAALCGVTVVPVDAGASTDYVRQIAATVEAALLVHGPEQDGTSLGLPTQSIFLGADSVHMKGVVRAHITGDDSAVILFTSGTTSKPKGVVLTHGNLAAQVGHFTSWRWLTRLAPFRMLVIAPLSHSQGLLLGACLPLALGLSVIYTTSSDPAHVTRTIKDNRVTLLSTVPRALQQLTKSLERLPYGRSTLGERVRSMPYFIQRRDVLFRRTHAVLGYSFWVVLVGGAALPAADERFWREAGYYIVQGYGLTETAAIISINAPLTGRFGAIGRPLRGHRWQLAPDGEILVKGANVSPGYFRDEEATARTFANGYLHTGDLARRDARNRLYFVGRKKDIIVTGEGFNVYPNVVEEALAQLPGVRDSIVVGLERDGVAEVHAVLLLQPDAEPASIVRQANLKLQEHERIHSWSVWPGEDFPRSNLLKVQRHVVADHVRQLRDQAATPDVRPGGRVSLADIQAEPDRRRRLHLIAGYVTSAQGGESEGDQARLVEDFGLSSLDMAEMLALVEQQGQVSLTDSFVPPAATVADIRALVRNEGGSRAAGRLPSRQPAWSSSPLGSALRGMVRPIVVGYWASFCARLRTCCHANLAEVSRPLIVAAAPHRHWLDALAIYHALPPRFRRHMMTVTNEDFHDYFDPSPGTTLPARLAMGVAYYLAVPLLFSFTILTPSGTTRQGLQETGRLIDRGHIPVMFPKGILFYETDAERHDPGMALLAVQTQATVLPIWISGNDDLDWRPHRQRTGITVHFGRPITAGPGADPANVMQELEGAWAELATCLHYA